MKKSTAEIVHESASNRQHVRVQIPATVEIGSSVYSVENLSAGGIRIGSLDRSFRNGQVLDIGIDLPFGSFSLYVDVKAKVEYCDDTNGVMGCRFIELRSSQVSILSFVLKSFMAGSVVSEGDILNVVSRDNFVRPRAASPVQEKNDWKMIARRVVPTLSLCALGLVALSFMGANIYEKSFVLKSRQALVTSEIMAARAPLAGNFHSLVPEGEGQVTEGQDLAEIRGFTLSPEGKSIEVKSVIKSPCDCYLLEQPVREGSFRNVGEPVFNLVPIDVRSWVEARVPPNEAQRIYIEDEASIHVAGRSAFTKAVVTAITTATDGTGAAIIKLRPEAVLPSELIGRPATVDFFLD